MKYTYNKFGEIVILEDASTDKELTPDGMNVSNAPEVELDEYGSIPASELSLIGLDEIGSPDDIFGAQVDNSSLQAENSLHAHPDTNILVPKRNRLAEWFADNGFAEFTPSEFYSLLYGTGLLASTSKQIDSKGVGMVQTLIKPLTKSGAEYAHTEYVKSFYDGNKGLISAIEHSNKIYASLSEKWSLTGSTDPEAQVLVLTNGCTYYGNRMLADNIYQLLAIIVELDDIISITENGQYIPLGLLSLLDQTSDRERKYPRPTFIACSGNGLHLYYVLDEPIRMNRKSFKQHYGEIDAYKKCLMRALWNKSIVNPDTPLQSQGIDQRYRGIGTPTKRGSLCRVFKTGSIVSLSYMNSFCQSLGYQNPVTGEFTSCPKLKQIENTAPGTAGQNPRKQYKEPEGKKGTMHVNAYYNMLERARTEATVGHRYYFIYCLAVTAKMCNISYEQFEKDAWSLYDSMQALSNSPDNAFTEYDMQCAIENYHRNKTFMKRETVENLCNIVLPPAKPRSITGKANGRWWDVIAYRLMCPTASKVDCLKYMNISNTSVYKYWKLIENWNTWSKYEVDIIKKSIAGHKPAEIIAGSIPCCQIASTTSSSTPKTVKAYAQECLERHHFLNKYNARVQKELKK